MIDNEVTQLPSEPDNPYALALDVYLRGVAAILLLLGLRQWLYIAGVFQDDGWSFETMSTQWRFVTIHLAVVDLVAAVGLWMRVAWGNVIWIYVALFEIAMHTVFAETFGLNLFVVSFHVIALLVFVGLLVMSRRHEAATG
ncbi:MULTISPECIES: DUF6163 family protein [Kaistia]|uniref:DUF6163 family protein n=1 Tax=Kaistia nematophila TaxID=2994654 RepID=A0A9X3IJK7_9HYPH|nr:DUF6163 family protein [Kaistia nematophila]MBN9058416.1 hypothetical protein [Hyphomicrobiales bacterium]MCX5568669.1 DUF6163 family protein [Kaistia nematophila]